ncbi:MAG: thioredoxin domain-containing protein [Deltaproteobacteria bacterium]|nr:thioredoxin domain-containing protein [Deltaproteobacteria bacterium]
MSKSASGGFNRLKHEKSPYLRQHARNPVDWRPWSDAAFSAAAEADKPVIISIGYSSCHWCHVMERESFEDAETARLMNENFICIKVDREERPDLDSLYMKAVQAMTGHGGWPLTVFATPHGEPFYGGSYFPPEDSYGLPSFKHVLEAVARLYRENRDGIGATASGLTRLLSEHGETGGANLEIGEGFVSDAFSSGMLFYDPVFGGFGRGTKFPQAMFLNFALKHYERTRSDEAAQMLDKTLTAMAEGGIYDQLGGGFHRYSVDNMWMVPHFEKMLYDNALLADLYCRAGVVLKKPLFKEISLDIIGWLSREMRSSQGGFHSAMDADSDGSEGAYYLWDYDEYMRVIESVGVGNYAGYYSVTPEGNLDNKNVLRIDRLNNPAIPPSDVLARMKDALLKARSGRNRPAIDGKVITAWNGLAITALSRAGRAFDRPELVEAAEQCAGFILSSSVDRSGRLMRYWLDGQAPVKAGLEDYALMGSALLALHEAGAGGRPWLEEAERLTESMIALFYSKDNGRFYDVAEDQGALFIRERDLFDSDIPSGNSAAAGLLFNMSKACANARYALLATGIMTSAEAMRDEPLSHANMLCVLEDMLSNGGLEP